MELFCLFTHSIPILLLTHSFVCSFVHSFFHPFACSLWIVLSIFPGESPDGSHLVKHLGCPLVIQTVHHLVSCLCCSAESLQVHQMVNCQLHRLELGNLFGLFNGWNQCLSILRLSAQNCLECSCSTRGTGWAAHHLAHHASICADLQAMVSVHIFFCLSKHLHHFMHSKFGHSVRNNCPRCRRSGAQVPQLTPAW